MKSTVIYAVRHAMSEGNLQHRMQGHFDAFLAPGAQNQIQGLKERFDSVAIDAVYASDRYRALMTALPVAQSHHVALRAQAKFRERFIGAFEDSCWGNFERFHSEQARDRKINPFTYAPAGEESMRQAAERLRAAIISMGERHVGQQILLVTHMEALKSMLALIRGATNEDMLAIGHIGNTMGARLRLENGRLEIEEIEACKATSWGKDPHIWFEHRKVGDELLVIGRKDDQPVIQAVLSEERQLMEAACLQREYENTAKAQLLGELQCIVRSGGAPVLYMNRTVRDAFGDAFLQEHGFEENKGGASKALVPPDAATLATQVLPDL